VLHKADLVQILTRWCVCCYAFERPARHVAVTSISHELTCHRVASAPFSLCGGITYLRRGLIQRENKDGPIQTSLVTRKGFFVYPAEDRVLPQIDSLSLRERSEVPELAQNRSL
jgi:hypothetical protein